MKLKINFCIFPNRAGRVEADIVQISTTFQVRPIPLYFDLLKKAIEVPSVLFPQSQPCLKRKT